MLPAALFLPHPSPNNEPLAVQIVSVEDTN